jgi:hypothetical protein
MADVVVAAVVDFFKVLVLHLVTGTEENPGWDSRSPYLCSNRESSENVV